MGAEFALSFGWPVTVEKAWIRAIFRRWAAQTKFESLNFGVLDSQNNGCLFTNKFFDFV
jgi:hypothetical protein